MFDSDFDEDDLIGESQTYDPREGHKKGDYSLPIFLAPDQLDQMCLYCYTFKCEAITKAALVNMQNLVSVIDMRPYKSNGGALSRFEFLRLALEARIDLNLDTKALVKDYVTRNCDSRWTETIVDEILKPYAKQSINIDIARYLNSMIWDNLINGWSFDWAKSFAAIQDHKESGGYNRIRDFADDIKKLINRINGDINRSENYKKSEHKFDLSSSNAMETIKEVRTKLSAPSNKLRTGIQFLNRMLNGGYESGRSYLYMGVTGVGKSIILLSTALWIMKYNSLPIEDGKTNAVLFISQENSLAETFERIFNINVSGDDIRNFSEDEIYQGLKDSGIISDGTNPSKINFLFEYYNDQEISVTDIDDIISKYDRDGYKVVAVVQDYIERLRTKIFYNEIRSSLGSLATDLSELAKKWQIPVISAAQLNRTASSVVSDAISNNKTNTIKLLGKENISESWNILKNIDCAIIINRETDDTQESHPEYMGFKLEKYRGKPNKNRVYMFLHPFNQDNGILLDPDLDGKPLSRLTIEEFNPLTIRRQNKLAEKMNKEEDNEFLKYCGSLGSGFGDNTEEEYNTFMNMQKIADNEIQRRLKEAQEREKLSVRSTESSLLKPQPCLICDGTYIIDSRSWNYEQDEDGVIIIPGRKRVG